MKVQLDKSKYSTVGRSSCLIPVQWMKGQPRTKNPCLIKCHVHSYVCLGCACVCVGGWMGAWWGGRGGGMGEGDLRTPSPVICKSHEL